jgi:hypothetical protein
MAKIVTLEILVDSDDEAQIADGLNDMLRTAQLPVDPDDADARSWIIDWRLAVCGDQLRLQPLPPSVEDAIVNDTYSEGDAFPSSAAPLHPGLEYELIASDPKAMDSLWIGVPSHCDREEGGDLSVLVKRTHEGVILDVWPASQENQGEILSSAAAMFADAPHPEEAVA